MPRICSKQPAPTKRQLAIAREVFLNGGNLTADEIAHSAAFDRVALAWSRRRANQWIKREQEAGKWKDAHAHADGSIYVPRIKARAGSAPYR